MELGSMYSSIIQAVVAFFIFIILNHIAVAIMTNEEIIEDNTKSISKTIFKGWVETKAFRDKSFNTYNRFNSTYRKLPRSINKFGGAQFSYSVWVKFNNVSSENLGGKVLFLRGDKKQYPIIQKVNNKETKNVDYLIKSPLVKFGDNADKLIVEFNTTNNITQQAVISRVQSNDETLRHNVFSLMPGKWVLMTFIFEDDKRYDDYEDGVVFKFYLNDVLYHTQRFSGALRLNDGHLHMLPNSEIMEGYMADMTYYNYALGLNDIKNTLGKGFTNKKYDEMEGNPEFNAPLYLSQYNKLEINNR
jgi:hypothetical protein